MRKRRFIWQQAETDRLRMILMVAFSDLGFIFRFFPAFLAIFYLTKKKYRTVVLLLGSLIFYALGDWKFLPLLLAAVWLNYLLAKSCLYRKQNYEGTGCKRFLITAVCMDAGILAAFKILGALDGGILMPLGLSFYLFKMISFQADIYRGKIETMPSLKATAVYFLLFGQIVSGPIMRFGEGGFGQKREYSWERVEEGLQYFTIGLGTKILLADRLAILWKDIGVIGYESISTPLAWLGAISYSMQLYFDFWGYSLMASGICMMLGFPFIQNFNHPYASKSISEFWRRWHMTLGSFFRDYVYIPLGGSRGGELKTLRNLLAVWLLTGLWHGGSRNFIFWGLLLFIFIMLEKLWLGRIWERIPLLGHCWVLVLIPISWMFFAITDLEQLNLYLERLFPFLGDGGLAVNPNDIQKYLGRYWKYLAAGVIWCIPVSFRSFEKYRKNPIVIILTVIIFWFSVYCVISMGNNPFAYLKF